MLKFNHARATHVYQPVVACLVDLDQFTEYPLIPLTLITRIEHELPGALGRFADLSTARTLAPALVVTADIVYGHLCAAAAPDDEPAGDLLHRPDTLKPAATCLPVVASITVTVAVQILNLLLLVSELVRVTVTVRVAEGTGGSTGQVRQEACR